MNDSPIKRPKSGRVSKAASRLPRKPAADAPAEAATPGPMPTAARRRPAKTDVAPAARRGTAKAEAGRVQRPRRTARPNYDEQVPARPSRRRGASAPREEGYVRLRIRVSGERMTVVDSHLVAGPLALPATFATGNAYEVTDGERLLHAAALPDVGVQRSFVNPDGPPEQDAHHVTELAVYEFFARVPAHELTAAALPRLAVRLHRVKDDAGPLPRTSARRLDVEFPREVRPVAELVGLPDSVLPEAIERRGGRTPGV